MTQLEQAGRQATVLTSAAVALVVSLAITISSMLIIPQLTSAPAPEVVDRYAEAVSAWQAQRELESSHFRNHLHALVQGEAEWQLRYEQTNPNR